MEVAIDNGEEEVNESSSGGSEEDRFADDPVAEANAWLPSSLGISFFTNAHRLRIICSAARYETQRQGGRRSWARIPLGPQVIEVDGHTGPVHVLDEHARIHLRRRRFGTEWLVTCALVNAHSESDTGKDWDLMLLQSSVSIETLDGEILEYPSTRLTSRDEEEQELRVQYRHAKTYAIGHGCAVVEGWTDERVTKVFSEVMPQQIVDHVRAAGPVDSPVLSLAHLADPDLSSETLRSELTEFIAGYRAWFDEQHLQRHELPEWAQEPGQRITKRIQGVVERMSSGVKALTADQHAMTAFRLANRAMALQMRHYGEDLAGSRHRRDEAVPHWAEPDLASAWRPFQLAYFLLLVDGLLTEEHPDREKVDLLWFPTGGGKTEAYLLVACFVILLRRIRHPATGGGTTVLSRYTLSLLTAQQFQRAATTVCALEYLRRGLDRPVPDLGDEPIAIGLWVGMETTPNSYVAAAEACRELLAAGEPDDRFLLERCPWCGTEIVPRFHSESAAYGIRANTTSFKFFCPRHECAFNDELPVAVVDAHLYERPPTIVLGTVDKFARLAWEPKAGRLFGGGGRLRPSLVIQDELHLLSGPLGTTVGLYEAAILELCSWDGHRPKIIASTATIRRSSDQIRGLYGRETQLFPPPGLDARESYFTEPDPTRPGRLYVGVMAQGHTSSTATVHTGAAMLQAPMDIAVKGEAREAYWTLVAYHNSLRELGRTVTIAHDDIPARLKHLAADPATQRELPEGSVEELTSNIARAAQPRLLDRLGRAATAPDSVSFLATTNMLSVGVDVGRLALMLMNGQPKTTAEYIQATSRVGRAAVPGLIVTLFRSTKPRDRSHYETFGVYHRSLYRHVEPTSVTPWSLQSRWRALHAVLVILIRHGLGLAGEDKAGRIVDHDEEIEAIVQRIVDFAAAADPREAEVVRAELIELLEYWRQMAQMTEAQGQRLYYRSQGRGQENLLKPYGHKQGEWDTLQSMRSIDRECLLKVRGAR
ncbi:helicase-related protein [Streptosporangium sp. NPDC049078]|uniref:helicase-related protein n=1 Tax=Streptosporangium sp. NPDC049078 TaxID=3155767 RepID=UPI003434F2F0